LQAARIDEVRQAGGKATWGTAKMVIADIEKWRRTRPMPVTLGQ
jgi:hypothetical protein